ncbi:MAG: hypothetical protein ACK4MX_00585 [Thermaurantiacus sp.]
MATTHEDIDWIGLSGAKAKGKRPAFFDDPAIDRLLSIVMALAAEVSVNRERMDTIERLLDAKGVISRTDIESFAPDRDAGYERGLAARAYIARILRGVQQDMEALAELEPPLEEVAQELGRT